MPLAIQQVREDLPEDMVPVDRRWRGLDRATMRPALLVLALAVLFTVLLPLADAAVPGRDTARPGDVLELANGVTFAPAPGWAITSGLRPQPGRPADIYPPRAVVTDGSVQVTVTTAPWFGTVAGLLDQVRATPGASGFSGQQIGGDAVGFRTGAGVDGLQTTVSGAQRSGVLAAVVLASPSGPVGVLLSESGPVLTPEDRSAEVQAMIQSIGGVR